MRYLVAGIGGWFVALSVLIIVSIGQSDLMALDSTTQQVWMAAAACISMGVGTTCLVAAASKEA